MPDYKYTQQSGTDWKVNVSDKADAMEDTNEIRAVVDELGRLLVHSKKDGSFPEDLTEGGTLAIPANLVEVSEIGTATYDDMQDWINNTQSGGRISGGTIDDDTSGGITISAGTGFTKTTTGDIGLTKSFDWSADAIVSTGLTDDSANYIYMDYNATGNPQILATADRTTIRLQDQFTLGRVYKSGNDIHIINSGVNLYNAGRRMHEVKIEVSGFQRASGGIISESAVTERALDSTEGIFFLGDNEIITSAKNTSTGGSNYFTSWYYDGADWQSTTGETQIDKLQYNDTSTGLANLTANRYGVHWVYIHYDSDIQTVYGQGDYTLAQAEMATIPESLPSAVNDFGTLASKIILQQGSTGFTSVVTAYKTLFPVSSPPDHNDLGGLQGGTANEYYHFNSANYSELNNWAGAVTLSTGGTINLVTFSTGGTVNVPTGQEYQINGLEVKLDEWATPTDVTTLNATTGLHGLLPKRDGDAAHWLDGSGAWTAPTASEVGALESSGAFTVNAIPQITSTGGVLKASVFAVTTGDTFNFGAHSAGFTEQAIATTTGTAAINWSNGIKALFTRSTGSAGAVTFSFTAPPKSVNLQLTIKGSSVGSTGTITWPAVYWQGGTHPTLTSGANALDVVSFYYSTGLAAYLGLGSDNFSTV